MEKGTRADKLGLSDDRLCNRQLVTIAQRLLASVSFFKYPQNGDDHSYLSYFF